MSQQPQGQAPPPRPPSGARQPPMHLPFPQQQAPLPLPPRTNYPPPPTHHQFQPYPQQYPGPEEHSFIQQQLQTGPPAPPPGPGPAYGHFPPNDRVKVIKGNASVGGGHRRDSTDTESVGGGHGVVRTQKRRKAGGRDPFKERFSRYYIDQRERINLATRILLANPADSTPYSLKLYPYSLKRSALINQIELDEEASIESAQNTYDEDKAKFEEEWRKGKEDIRSGLMAALELRRKKAKDEMANDGVLADAPAFETPAATRSSTKSKPPPFTLAAPTPYVGGGGEEMVSPFPLALTAGTGTFGANSRKRQKGVGPSGSLTLGKAIGALTALKENEIEADLGEVKKAVKRKRRAGIVAGQYRD